MANFGINGFGRIGRNVLRAMSQDQVAQVRAINDLTDTHTLAHLLKWDSVHGKFDGEIGYDDENIIVRGRKIKVLKERDPAKLPWKDLGVDVVLESTGFFTSREKAELHFVGGAKKVLISAPAKNPDATICMGINDNIYDAAKMNIVSNASCTTNCLAPLARVLHENFTIVNGFMSTIHSYTNDQRILDFPHEDLRRAPRGGGQHYSFEHRGGEGDRRSVAGAERQTERRCLSGPDAGRIRHRFHRGFRKGRDGRINQRRLQACGQRCEL